MKNYVFGILFFFGIFGCDRGDGKIIKDADLSDVNDPSQEHSACYPLFTDNEFKVVTWNTKFFPLNGQETIDKVISIVKDLDVDIIALQEISDTTNFYLLGSQLKNWEAIHSNVRFGQELGFLYKKNAFSSFDCPVQLFDDDSDAFPRQPIMTTVTHINGLKVTLINVHLKCCGEDGSEEQKRRESASIKMKEYIDEHLRDQNVIVLGDFNDDIGADFVSPFQNFIDDSDYLFADQEVANGSSELWSYPSWPSHLDHILVSNELFDLLDTAHTVLLDNCVERYFSTVSDHRPVLATFK